VTFGVYFNAGECCNSGSRIIVHEDIAEDFTAGWWTCRAGWPSATRWTRRRRSAPSSRRASCQDRRLCAGGAAPQGAVCRWAARPCGSTGLPGEFYAPTIVTGVTPDMAIAREEVFGPVLSVLTFRTLDEALAWPTTPATACRPGSGARMSTPAWPSRGGAQAGTVWTNTWMDGFPEVTFGGMKQSGLGRENRQLRAGGVPGDQVARDARRPHARALGEDPADPAGAGKNEKRNEGGYHAFSERN
jgi:betaine-aldehyde dehydrogenase